MTRPRIEFEDVLRWFALAGVISVLGATAVSVLGFVLGALVPFYGSTLRFLIAALLVTAPYAELLEVRQARFRRMTTGERLGFTAHDAAR
jgi:hypothetical protein